MKKRILFIGAGKLGTTLARAISQKGFSIPVFYSKEFPKNKFDFLPDTEFIGKLSEENVDKCNTLIITVPDDQITEVVKQLVLLKIEWQDKLVLHTSGCLSSNELHPLKLQKAQIGSIHPMQTFNEFFLPIEIFKGIVFAVEGDDQVVAFARSIVEVLGANLIKLNPEVKTIYHIAAVASSNFLVALLDYINQLYKDLGFDKHKIKTLLLPIVNQTLNNFSENPSREILTGPLKRGDLKTIENHIKILNKDHKNLLPMYKEISKYISSFILENDDKEKEKLNRVLND